MPADWAVCGKVLAVVHASAGETVAVVADVADVVVSAAAAAAVAVAAAYGP